MSNFSDLDIQTQNSIAAVNARLTDTSDVNSWDSAYSNISSDLIDSAYDGRDIDSDLDDREVDNWADEHDDYYYQ